MNFVIIVFGDDRKYPYKFSISVFKNVFSETFPISSLDLFSEDSILRVISTFSSNLIEFR